MADAKLVRKTFSAPMAHAIWHGFKGETRRLVKIHDERSVIAPGDGNAWAEEWRRKGSLPTAHINPDRPNRAIAPSCQPGDMLVVAEPWRTRVAYDHLKPSELDLDPQALAGEIWYEADGPCRDFGRLRPARFMPSSIARSRRRITEVRFEQLSDITEEAAENEGVLRGFGYFVDHPLMRRKDGRPARFETAVIAFAHLWDAVHHERVDAWEQDRDKLVEVIKFERRVGE